MSRGPWVVALALALMLGAAGCATTPLGTLSGVLRDGRLAQGTELTDVSLVRDGDPVAIQAGMVIQKDDSIFAGPNSQVVLIFQEDWEVVVDSGTVLYVVNPKTWLERGKVFIKKLVQRAKEAFEVEDEHATYAAAATQYVVTSDGAGTVTLAVVEGEVVVESKTERFPRSTYGPMQQGRVEGDSVINRMSDLTQAEAAQIRRTFAEAERLTTVTVPELSGLTREAAVRQLESLGLRLGDTDTRLTGTAEEGAVIEQTPQAGPPARAGSTVDLVFEAPGARVPDLSGLTREDAEDQLEEVGLRVTVREQDDPDAEPGTVIRQSRRAEELVPPGTRVTLTVASDRVTVPNLVQSNLDRATQLLERAGLTVGQVRESERPNVEPGTVVAQSVGSGTRVTRGSSVDLTVAVAPRLCVVPNLIQLTDARAVARLRETGFRVGTRTTQGDMDFDIVWGQDPQANTRTRCGTAVNLRFGRVG